MHCNAPRFRLTPDLHIIDWLSQLRQNSMIIFDFSFISCHHMIKTSVLKYEITQISRDWLSTSNTTSSNHTGSYEVLEYCSCFSRQINFNSTIFYFNLVFSSTLPGKLQQSTSASFTICELSKGNMTNILQSFSQILLLTRPGCKWWLIVNKSVSRAVLSSAHLEPVLES